MVTSPITARRRLFSPDARSKSVRSGSSSPRFDASLDLGGFGFGLPVAGGGGATTRRPATQPASGDSPEELLQSVRKEMGGKSGWVSRCVEAWPSEAQGDLERELAMAGGTGDASILLDDSIAPAADKTDISSISRHLQRTAAETSASFRLNAIEAELERELAIGAGDELSQLDASVLPQRRSVTVSKIGSRLRLALAAGGAAGGGSASRLQRQYGPLFNVEEVSEVDSPLLSSSSARRARRGSISARRQLEPPSSKKSHQNFSAQRRISRNEMVRSQISASDGCPTCSRLRHGHRHGVADEDDEVDHAYDAYADALLTERSRSRYGSESKRLSARKRPAGRRRKKREEKPQMAPGIVHEAFMVISVCLALVLMASILIAEMNSQPLWL